MAESESWFGAWQPVTPRGVAAFARATSGRLLLLQFVVALGVTATVEWFLLDAWIPTVTQAIAQLPDQGEIRGGKLDWRGGSPRLLAEGKFLALSVDATHSGEIRASSHVEVEFSRETIFLHSLLGFLELRYPAGWRVAFNRVELAPWWGAWQPALLGLVALAMVAGLLIAWCGLATLYAFPVWVLALFANRDLKPVECWRLAGAALMPGALLLGVGVLCYDFGIVDLVGLGFLLAGHLVLGWIYVFISPLFLPQSAAAKVEDKNPFAGTGQK